MTTNVGRSQGPRSAKAGDHRMLRSCERSQEGKKGAHSRGDGPDGLLRLDVILTGEDDDGQEKMALSRGLPNSDTENTSRKSSITDARRSLGPPGDCDTRALVCKRTRRGTSEGAPCKVACDRLAGDGDEGGTPIARSVPLQEAATTLGLILSVERREWPEAAVTGSNLSASAHAATTSDSRPD